MDLEFSPVFDFIFRLVNFSQVAACQAENVDQDICNKRCKNNEKGEQAEIRLAALMDCNLYFPKFLLV